MAHRTLAPPPSTVELVERLAGLVEAHPAIRALSAPGAFGDQHPLAVHAHESDAEAPYLVVREPVGPKPRLWQGAVRAVRIEVHVEVPEETPATRDAGYSARGLLAEAHRAAHQSIVRQRPDGLAGARVEIGPGAYEAPSAGTRDPEMGVVFSTAAYVVLLSPAP